MENRHPALNRSQTHLIVYQCVPGTLPRKLIEWRNYVYQKTSINSKDIAD
jgi:hypothetical protein